MPQELHVQRAEERATLVKALLTVAVNDRRRRARRFLLGLSTDEMRYIASYLGACAIESALQPRSVPRCQLAREIQEYECCRASWQGQFSRDVEHKMIVLLEYLSSCECGAAVRVAAGSA
jgi:hypothetical protein